MKAGDVHPEDPNVVRMHGYTVQYFVETKGLDGICSGCPVELVWDYEQCEGENPCGSGFVWYGEHIAAVNKVRNK